MSTSFLTPILNRRSIYNLKSTSKLSKTEIESIVRSIVINAPTSFNIQSVRALILTEEKASALWSSVISQVSSTPNYPVPVSKFERFKKAHGTVIFFDDLKPINELTQKSNRIFTEQVPIWAANSNGFAQISIWSALESEGLGANLQHYNDFVSKAIKDLGFKVPEYWVVRAELVFGDVESPPGDKTFIKEESVIVL